MIVEIHGAGFQNKGAELMLRTVVSELRQRLPNFEPAIDPSYGSYTSRCELGLLQIFPLRSHVGTPAFSKRFRRQRSFTRLRGDRLFPYVTGARLSQYGCVTLSQVEALLDISGFAYTDQWGSQPTKDFAELTQYYKSLGEPVVLLPQAFGPFDQRETRIAFRRVVENASLVFARDRQSYEYVVELASDQDKVLQAPDITLFHPYFSDDEPDAHCDYACVVPNIRMIDQGKHKWGEKYETRLTLIVNELVKHRLQVRIVVHDISGGDLRIAHNIGGKINSSHVTVVEESDPVAFKEMIGDALMLVGSRYHSLVAALSKKVPVIALGWAHKYEMLLEDFGCEELLVSSETPMEAVLGLVRHLMDQDVNMSYRHRIAERLPGMYVANQQMWERVIHVLTSKI